VSIQNDTPSRSRTRTLVITALKGTVSIALLWLLFSRVDIARLWSVARNASTPWLLSALALYAVMIFASAWRWGLLLRAQHLVFSLRSLISSFLVATFFNNFLPSNIGGDVIRIADTAPAAGSKTLATTVVLLDRGIGLLGLVLMAAIGATVGPRFGDARALGAGMLWAGFAAAVTAASLGLLFPEATASRRVGRRAAGAPDRHAGAFSAIAFRAGRLLLRCRHRPDGSRRVLSRDRSQHAHSRQLR
jgi:uncharacterized membrane protein YbhN (UPF0104 family)